jgi:hypothetical protein
MEIRNSASSTQQKRGFEQEDGERNVKGLKPYNEETFIELDIRDTCLVSAQRFPSEEDVYIKKYLKMRCGSKFNVISIFFLKLLIFFKVGCFTAFTSKGGETIGIRIEER